MNTVELEKAISIAVAAINRECLDYMELSDGSLLVEHGKVDGIWLSDAEGNKVRRVADGWSADSAAEQSATVEPKNKNQRLAAALRRFVDKGAITADDYSAIRGHACTTFNDRDALTAIMHSAPMGGESQRLTALADKIEAHI